MGLDKNLINNAKFYTEFHNLVCKLKDYFEDTEINIGSCDPAGMTFHEIAMIAAWECFHKNPELAEIIDSAKRNLEIQSNFIYKADLFHIKK